MENPVQLFTSLPLKPGGKIKDLWDIEKEVLQKYFDEFKEHNRVAIELPTGSGKSVIGLLLLEAWRRVGKRVAILTSSSALADDMVKRCDELGIESALITGKREGEVEAIARVQNKRRYTRKQAIGVMNYWAYMMGRDIAEPDVLVVDDADFFENFLISYYSIVVSRSEDEDIWNQLMYDLERHRIYQARIEAFRFSDTTEEVQLVYFTHSVEMAKKIRTLVLSGGGGISQELSYSFDRNKDFLETYLMFVTRDAIVFAPYITPGLMHERLRGLERIVFMSATIGSLEYIHRTLGSSAELKTLTEKDVKSQVGTMGKRIVFPLDGIAPSPHIEDDVLRAVTIIYETFGKALIICNSYRDADRVTKVLQSRGHPATIYRKEADSTSFAKASSGALVTAGRFIGIDLPDDTCRVGIITKMPFVLGPTDALTMNLLGDTDYVNEKVSHRLVQAFGRCNRSPQDYAVYFMLDSRLANDNQADAEICGFFPRRMRAELDYGQDYAETGGVDRCLEIAKLLLDNKLPSFEGKITEHLRYVGEPRVPEFKKPYVPEIQAWHDLTVSQNYLDAAQRFVECIHLYQKSSLAGELIKRQLAWLHYLAAKCHYLAYLNYGNEDYKAKVIEHLKNAISEGKTSWFSGLQLVINELGVAGKKEEEVVFDTETQDFREKLLRSWREFAQTNTSKKRDPKKVWEEIRRALSTGKHNEVCDKLKLVFELMGFEVRKRYQEESEPDLELFTTTRARYVCIVEVKTKDERPTAGEIKEEMVGREAVDQVGGHKPRYQSAYSNQQIYALLYTNKEGFSDAAVSKATSNVRLLRSSEFSSFLNKFFELMEKGWKATSPYDRLAVMSKMLMPDEYGTILAPRETPIVTIEELNALVKW